MEADVVVVIVVFSLQSSPGFMRRANALSRFSPSQGVWVREV